ncbi:related to ALO1 - D-arabinono-1,4-lactone oxidase [Cephalotrichum gorgonifer]|uniref:Related to ALO1 - D-arabinono-1,4-lactone oxidase n=1 Tax=Cephalotrichum gorgonifer TaxID=2041049 RepID=A0AAE8N474_9PEZI|nr:related to ALO1 - D-arabinono-1,4-lactone oxidase [Cephalotrichum gorgonifer]
MLRRGFVFGLAALAAAEPYNTFDGPGFPACNEVAAVHEARTVDEIQGLVQDAIAAGQKVRASGLGHMWYDTMCSDDPNTVIIRTENVNRIWDLDLQGGSVWFEAGVTFLQLAEWLHDRGASVGYTLVNWNITLAGSVAMGAHRSSIREDSMVAAGVLEMDVIDGKGEVRRIVRDNDDDTWLAASTSLGLLGVIVRMKFKIYPDFKVYADQKILDEEEVLDGDIEKLIVPYATANLWWWPYKKKFHWRYYDVVPDGTSDQEGFQNTFSVTKLEAIAAKALLNSGKYLPTSNFLAEEIFFGRWEKPNFRDKATQKPIEKWPVYGWNYDVLIGGLYPDQRPVWEYGLHGYTLELAFPMTQANDMLRRVRELFDDEARKGRIMTSTYTSGINIKFGRPYFDLLGQVTYNETDEADWTRGAIMFDFPSFHPSVGDGLRYNEPFYHNLANVLVDEFPCRPHWTKNTRDVFERSAKNINPDNLRRFKAVREKFDPNSVYRSVVGEKLGLYDD